MTGRSVVVFDRMQQGYVYELVEPEGQKFSPLFTPDLTPQEMLEMGIFGGRYMTDSEAEFPSHWFTKAIMSPNQRDDSLNYFGVGASQSLSVWRRNGWINPVDPRGWFQWYCRYYFGRRLILEDNRQILRWKAMRRHIAQIQNNCLQGDWRCRARQRQALLHWAYDSRQY